MTTTDADEFAGVVTTIELDCPPDAPRPADLIDLVIAGTGLKIDLHPVPIHGQAIYVFDVPGQDWVERIRPIVKPRIEALHRSGMIRYGSW